MPVSWPAMANRRWPSAPISATRSLARVAVSYPPWGLPDSPIPRWSGATTWKSRASGGISSRQAYQVWGQPCTSSSGGPSPPVTTCWRRSPVSTYRLVNVAVNPSGRFGAPETEPGPSGVGRRAADELMRGPLSQVVLTHDRAPGGRVAPVTPWSLLWSAIVRRSRLHRVRLAGLPTPGRTAPVTAPAEREHVQTFEHGLLAQWPEACADLF